MSTNEEPIVEDFFNVVDQLNPANRRDVLDVAVYLIWRQTGKPAPFWIVVRGWWKYNLHKIGGNA